MAPTPADAPEFARQLFTSWLTVRLRSRTAEQFMTASRALPASVIGILLMSEFVGAKSTIGTAQEAFIAGFAAFLVWRRQATKALIDLQGKIVATESVSSAFAKLVVAS